MKKINISITKKGSIENAIKMLEEYKKEIRDKTQIFIEKLLDIGIEMAYLSAGSYGNVIVFKKELNPVEYGCEGLFIAMDKQKIVREWVLSNGEVKSVEISPLLMSEFGSGWFAEVLYSELDGKVGQGTFPGQKHAFDPRGWFWTDKDKKKHYSKGESPSHPIHNAEMAMIGSVKMVAREVFK